ncbi:Helicase associated domain protein [Streptomyces sp. MUM 136J]|uniref:Helicase associated domain protein n=1 Tax=Streptomyces sp. MUM 136J TaxID=2791992 RepID=UPI001F04F65E|nr:Helicase associated domain protein [Streptomyces sp. MUM 136J]MCH0573069.1 Helicase associated domain protein [Streptomyces sp. MUM 136J]
MSGESRNLTAAGPIAPPSGALRVGPLQGEMTQSFLIRLAARYGIAFRDLLAAIVDVGGLPNVMGRARPDSEVYLNQEARDRAAQLCRVPQDHLLRALPAWAQEEPRRRFASGPAAQFHHTAEKVRRWGPACPACTARRTGRQEAARLYLGPEQRVCLPHRRWLMQIPGTVGRVVNLAGNEQVLEARHRHVRLLRRSARAADAFEVAQAVTASWWWQTWPREHVWPSRLRSLDSGGLDQDVWQVVARELVTYPETVALATLLVSDDFRRRVVAEAQGHVPFRLADLPTLLTAVAGCMWRPWYVDQLAQETSGPLFAWAYQCVRAQGGTNAEGQEMWAVAPAHRQRPLVDELAVRAGAGPGGQRAEGKRRRGHSRQADEAFATGLAHARRYVREHGNLAVPQDTVVDSYRLGEWLGNVQARAWAMAPDRAQALTALDPWWNVPWSVQWQRSYYRARDHAAVAGPPDAAAGFPGTQILNGEWLYLQCTHYSTLHPEQQRLLADIGITAEAARTALPRRVPIQASFETGLTHARSYAAEHGCLAAADKDTMYQGYPLGPWLARQRRRARQSPEPTERSRTLDAIDPWWNPPWGPAWQRSYAQARRLVESRSGLDMKDGFPGAEADLAQWLSRQCAAYRRLDPDQQRLLADIGITAEEAAKVQGRAGAPQVENEQAAAVVLWALDGMTSARSFASAHGHLAVPSEYVHDGFALGRWLVEQRRQDRRHAQATGGAWPRGRLLAELDPWWNPPWPYPWQRRYQQARKRWQRGRLKVPGPHHGGDEDEVTVWLRRQCARHDVLQPEQQNLLADIGITSAVARTVTEAGRSPAPVDTGLAHARSYAAEHGHLAVAERTRHNDYPLGSWLLRQRHRVADGRTDPTRIAALNALDPHWNPPWPLAWQRTYHRARTATTSGNLTTAQHRWITTQTRLWDSLHPTQQELLASIGAAPATEPVPTPTTTRNYPPGDGLPHARSYAAAHGHLAVFKQTHHHGFALGHWLIQQRRKARAGLLSARTLQELTLLDPWWNPPWPFAWQRKYHQHRTLHTTSQPLPPELQRWARKQTTLWPQLHPYQQALLTATGIHAPSHGL